ncbi:hypothetical protein BDZ85DRAFT_255435 [Elsinoe ampelina]|uniref:Uncharacterized protein n=1 Tax=Elsinoe ampelina TaxID=302913 RepID=A0A6A6GQS9_9PEZI|nr:hypothetical protein BDZ85DRAFT_255435 [Elsinoe ampelina]
MPALILTPSGDVIFPHRGVRIHHVRLHHLHLHNTPRLPDDVPQPEPSRGTNQVAHARVPEAQRTPARRQREGPHPLAHGLVDARAGVFPEHGHDVASDGPLGEHAAPPLFPPHHPPLDPHQPAHRGAELGGEERGSRAARARMRRRAAGETSRRGKSRPGA